MKNSRILGYNVLQSAENKPKLQGNMSHPPFGLTVKLEATGSSEMSVYFEHNACARLQKRNLFVYFGVSLLKFCIPESFITQPVIYYYIIQETMVINEHRPAVYIGNSTERSPSREAASCGASKRIFQHFMEL
jgi:hypothetical protein